MKVVNTKMSQVTVEVKRTIGVGINYNIAGSYAYSGIDPGTVKVLAIGHVEDIYQMTNLNPGVASYIEEHTEVELDSMACGLPYPEDNTDYIALKDELENGIWVVYEYPVGYSDAVVAEQCVLPLELFVAHTIQL